MNLTTNSRFHLKSVVVTRSLHCCRFIPRPAVCSRMMRDLSQATVGRTQLLVHFENAVEQRHECSVGGVNPACAPVEKGLEEPRQRFVAMDGDDEQSGALSFARGRPRRGGSCSADTHQTLRFSSQSGAGCCSRRSQSSQQKICRHPTRTGTKRLAYRVGMMRFLGTFSFRLGCVFSAVQPMQTSALSNRRR